MSTDSDTQPVRLIRRTEPKPLLLPEITEGYRALDIFRRYEERGLPLHGMLAVITYARREKP